MSYVEPVAGVPTLTRAGATPPGCRNERAVGNDGLTDLEREDLARKYREGPAREATDEELRAVAEWLRRRRANAGLA